MCERRDSKVGKAGWITIGPRCPVRYWLDNSGDAGSCCYSLWQLQCTDADACGLPARTSLQPTAPPKVSYRWPITTQSLATGTWLDPCSTGYKLSSQISEIAETPCMRTLARSKLVWKLPIWTSCRTNLQIRLRIPRCSEISD